MQGNENLKLYTTDATEVRNMTAKDTGIGISSIWNEKDIGSTINEQAKGFALKGDRVIINTYSGSDVKYEGEEYKIVRQSDILAIIE